MTQDWWHQAPALRHPNPSPMASGSSPAPIPIDPDPNHNPNPNPSPVVSEPRSDPSLDLPVSSSITVYCAHRTHQCAAVSAAPPVPAVPPSRGPSLPPWRPSFSRSLFASLTTPTLQPRLVNQSQIPNPNPIPGIGSNHSTSGFVACPCARVKPDMVCARVKPDYHVLYHGDIIA